MLQWLKPEFFAALAARLKRLRKNAIYCCNIKPQRLKAAHLSSSYGMPEGIP